jgi:hypothetical protein
VFALFWWSVTKYAICENHAYYQEEKPKKKKKLKFPTLLSSINEKYIVIEIMSYLYRIQRNEKSEFNRISK